MPNPEIRYAILLLMALHPTSQAYAATDVVTETSHYKIFGESQAELAEEMLSKSPSSGQRRTFPGRTTWEVTRNVKTKRHGWMCHIDAIETVTRIRYQLPEWINKDDAGAELQEQWDSFYRALVAHEIEHGNIAVAAANELESSVARLEPHLSCWYLHYQADRLGDRIAAETHQRQADYDRDTDHGATTGAAFP